MTTTVLIAGAKFPKFESCDFTAMAVGLYETWMEVSHPNVVDRTPYQDIPTDYKKGWEAAAFHAYKTIAEIGGAKVKTLKGGTE